MKSPFLLCWVGLTLCSAPVSYAQAESQPPKTASVVLPGKGLATHDFLYAGESKYRRIFIVRKGHVVWSYEDPAGRGEISDAVLLSNGNVLIAHQYAIKLISPDKKLLWSQEAPQGTEIHTAMPIGKEHVLYVQNGDPAWVKAVNIATRETKIQFNIPTGNPRSVHGHFRHARITPAGTLMVAHMDMGKVCEYDAGGKELWSYPIEGAWGVTPLKNGNILVVGRREVREVTHNGQTVASFTPADTGDYKLSSLQLAWRLPNGNTLINNWFNEWSGTVDKSNPPVQAVEMTPDKKVVWVLRSWEQPDLGPATTIQILDEPEAPENVSFGNIK